MVLIRIDVAQESLDGLVSDYPKACLSGRDAALRERQLSGCPHILGGWFGVTRKLASGGTPISKSGCLRLPSAIFSVNLLTDPIATSRPSMTQLRMSGVDYGVKSAHNQANCRFCGARAWRSRESRLGIGMYLSNGLERLLLWACCWFT
jgi:hypothetical protein